MEGCEGTKKILALCVDAIEEIQNDSPTGDFWVRRWGSLLGLLRTACEVLRKEAPDYWDKFMKEPNAGKKGRDRNNWEPDIFGKFIWTDANLFLHQGIIHEAESIMPHVPNKAMRIVQGATGIRDQEPLPSPRFSYFMNSEPYKGRLALDVATEAVEWLRSQVAIAESK
jgi:hypothetical protein